MMMSNPPPSLHNSQQRYHRRQNSTPVIAFEAMKVSNNNHNVPTTPTHQQRHGAHRRGLSFDQHQRSPIRRQQGNMVSITNVAQQLGQQILREAQQTRTQARPGQQQQQFHSDLPVTSPQCGIFPQTQPTTPFDQMTTSHIMHDPQGMQYQGSPYYYPSMSPMGQTMQNQSHVDENNQHYFQAMHQMQHQQQQASNQYDVRPPPPDLRIQTGMRPYTPTEQIQNGQFPPTPPFSQHHPSRVQYARSQNVSPSLHSPIPVPMQRGRSLQGIIEHDEMKPQSNMHERPRSMQGAPSMKSFESAEMPVPISAYASPAKSVIESEQAGSPYRYDSSLDGPGPTIDDQQDPFMDSQPIPSLQDQPVPILPSSQIPDGSQSPSKPALSPRRMSISDLNLEPGISASIEETNVTIDDIAQFIEGPDPRDNKYACKYEDCNKRFGRKENIKSHVQTHLGDRQFRCDHCQKCFVRGHDLKRHAKIHTGSKPYPCLCGNSFARHDALTRHRQRGMCIGAFEGIVKKVIKRGRPRKHRPEMDDRLDKAGRTRAHYNSDNPNALYDSSASSCSISSWGSPPTDSMDNLSIRGTSPFDDVALFGVPNHHTSDLGVSIVDMDNGNVNFHSDIFSFTPPASPGFSTGNKPSPSHTSTTSSSHHPSHHHSHYDHHSPTPTDFTVSPHMQNVHPHAINIHNTSSTPFLPQPHHHQQETPPQHSLPSLSVSVSGCSTSSPSATTTAPDMVSFDFADLSTLSSTGSITILENSASSTSDSQMPQKGISGAAVGGNGGAGAGESDRNDFDSFLDYEGMGVLEGESEFFAAL